MRNGVGYTRVVWIGRARLYREAYKLVEGKGE